MLSETDGRKTTKYIYKPGTNLLKKKLLLADGKIAAREFYDYDDYGIMIQRIVDNGTSPDRKNMLGTTQRLITRVTPKYSTPCFGLPEEVVESYWDPESEQEIQLRRCVNTYTKEGWLASKEIYDSQDQYCYTLYKEYNKYGQVNFETNPLGYSVRRNYDLNGNMIREIGPRPDCKKEYTYDYSNRLIRVDEYDENKVCFSNSFSYNYLSHKISEVNEFGHEVKHEYDRFGRETKIIFPQTLQPSGQFISTTASKEYDPLDNVISMTDSEGRTTKSQFTCHKKPYHISYPDGTEELFLYNLDGNLVKEVSRTGLITFHEYNALGQEVETRLESPTGELLQKTVNVYEGNLLTSTIDPAGNITSLPMTAPAEK